MKIVIELIVKNYNGGPKVNVLVGDEIMFEGHMKERGRQTIEFEAKSQLPEQITICHYDKNMKKDTKLGHNGVIVDDKAFIIDTVKIDDIKLKYELYLFDFTKVDGTVMKNNNYIGHNGKFVIDIDKDNLYAWYSGLQKSLVSVQEPFSYEQFRKEIFKNDL